MIAKILGWYPMNNALNSNISYKALYYELVLSDNELTKYSLDKISIAKIQKDYFDNELYNTKSLNKLFAFYMEYSTLVKQKFELVIFKDVAEFLPNKSNCTFLGFDIFADEYESMIFYWLRQPFVGFEIIYNRNIIKLNQYFLFDSIEDVNNFREDINNEKIRNPESFDEYIDSELNIKQVYIVNDITSQNDEDVLIEYL